MTLLPKDPPIKCDKFLREMKRVIGYCELHHMTPPRAECAGQLQACHIEGRRFGGGYRKDTFHNIVVACAACHRWFDGVHGSRAKLNDVKDEARQITKMRKPSHVEYLSEWCRENNRPECMG